MLLVKRMEKRLRKAGINQSRIIRIIPFNCVPWRNFHSVIRIDKNREEKQRQIRKLPIDREHRNQKGETKPFALQLTLCTR